jgi:putative Mg2+ transporter-C (MgtC) family protein
MEFISVPAGIGEIVLRLTVATILGAAVGFNREVQHKPAGLRTHALVALGAALTALIGLDLTLLGGGDAAAPSRVIQGLIAGVGFIGAGVILHRGRSVAGLTTAASVWVVAAIGAATGVGMWTSAVTAVVLALLVLGMGSWLDRAARRMGSSSDTPGDPE